MTDRRPRLHRWWRASGAVAVVATALALANLAVTCGPAPPSTDTCTLPPIDAGGERDGTITSIEVGTLDGTTFTPFVDDGVATLQSGGQGSTMIVAHLRLRGSGIPACLQQKTFVEQLDGTLLISEEAGLPMDADGAGGWVSGAMFLVYDRQPGVQVRIRTQIGAMERAVTVWVDWRGAVDAGVDATLLP